MNYDGAVDNPADKAGLSGWSHSSLRVKGDSSISTFATLQLQADNLKDTEIPYTRKSPLF